MSKVRVRHLRKWCWPRQWRRRRRWLKPVLVDVDAQLASTHKLSELFPRHGESPSPTPASTTAAEPFLLEVMLHAADIGNPAMDLPTAAKWALMAR